MPLLLVNEDDLIIRWNPENKVSADSKLDFELHEYSFFEKDESAHIEKTFKMEKISLTTKRV